MNAEAKTDTVRTLKRFLRDNPLAGSTLWHSDIPKTSQRESIARALRPDLKIGVILGGNRSGKTEAGAMLAVAYALGSADPGVQIWAKRSHLDISAMPERAGLVCCSALTGNDSRRVQREKVARYLPAGSIWSNQYGHGEAVARLPNGGVLLFKSNDQRARAYQGADWDFLWCDEEHDEPVFNEARMRLVDRSGRAIFTMTPLKGRTWVWSRFVDEPEPDSMFYALDSRDNPHIPQDYLEQLLARYGSHERAARSRGEFTELEGRVYSDFLRHVHVIDPFEVPKDWEVYASIDFGTRAPFACLLAALDPSDDTLHIIAEHYQREWTIARHAARMKEMFEEYGQPMVIVADPEDRGSRLTLAQDHDLATVKARKEVRAGISSVAERLAIDANGSPHLFFHSNCRNTVREIESYVWDVRRTTNAAEKDAPRKRDDHAMDALRYLCRFLVRSGFSAG